MRRLAAAAIATAGLALLVPAALADETIKAAFSVRYVNPDVTIDQGEKLTFTNGDVVKHDVTAIDTGTDHKPLFSTPLIGQNESAPVDGSQYLTTGRYSFICSVHANMQGTLTVSSAGTPVPRPGSGGGGSTDTTKPQATARIATASKSAARRAKALTVSVTSDEDVTLSAKATIRGTTVASGRSSASGGNRKVLSLALNRAGRRALARRGGVTVSIVVTATDGAGNRSSARASRTLR